MITSILEDIKILRKLLLAISRLLKLLPSLRLLTVVVLIGSVAIASFLISKIGFFVLVTIVAHDLIIKTII